MSELSHNYLVNVIVTSEKTTKCTTLAVIFLKMSAKIIPINTRREPVIYLDRLPYLDINALRKINKNNP